MYYCKLGIHRVHIRVPRALRQVVLLCLKTKLIEKTQIVTRFMRSTACLALFNRP